MPIILSITGSDGTGGSGVQADIKTISALGGRVVSAITSITMQNTLGIQDVYDLPAITVRGQIDAIINDVQPDTVRIGLVRNAETLDVVVETLQRYRPKYIVYDPIVTASNGDELLTNDVIALICSKLLPLCSIIVLRKHDKDAFINNTNIAKNTRIIILDNPQGHGYSNVFSSSLAVYLNTENSVDEAIIKAKEYAHTFVKQENYLIGRSAQLYNEFLIAVQQYHATNRDVAFYADCLNVSPTYLSQVAHKVSGKTPKNIIDQVLIETISNRLSSTILTIQEVAYAFNFKSQAQFTKYFKKQTGVTPSDFRKQR